MDAKTLTAIIGLAITIGGVGIYADDRFLQRAHASELLDQVSIDRERGDLETQVKLTLIELEYTEDEKKADYLHQKLLILEKRLLELNEDDE